MNREDALDKIILEMQQHNEYVKRLEAVADAARSLGCDESQTHNAYDVDIDGHKRLRRCLENLDEARR
jgi:hypothetical protein